MNIITGTARGTKLITLEGEETRPTLQRAKEAIFSAIQFDIEGRSVLDLFAGSGQLGLEALSRGASRCIFVDRSQDAFNVIKENAQKSHLYKSSRLVMSDWQQFLLTAKRSGEKYDLIFVDPPYRSGLLPQALKAIAVNGVCSDIATVIAEWDMDTLMSDEPWLFDHYELEKMYRSGRIYFYKLIRKSEVV